MDEPSTLLVHPKRQQQTQRNEDSSSLSSSELSSTMKRRPGSGEVESTAKRRRSQSVRFSDNPEVHIVEEDDDFREAGERATILKDGDIEIVPFNMDSEMEGGVIDRDGNYNPVRDREAKESDAWLQEYDENVKEMEEKALAVYHNKEEEEEGEEEVAPEIRLKAMSDMMRSGENVFAALRRLSGKVGEPKDMSSFEKLTEHADRLMFQHDASIYDATRDLILEKLYRIKQPQPIAQTLESLDQYESVMNWEYKDAEGQTHSPFSTLDILRWQLGGYFLSGVPFRPLAVTEQSIFGDEEWKDCATINFRQYLRPRGTPAPASPQRKLKRAGTMDATVREGEEYLAQRESSGEKKSKAVNFKF